MQKHREISENSSSLTIPFSWFTNVSSGCRAQRCCSTTSRNKALLMILAALRFEGRSVMELPRKRTNRLDIIEDQFTLCLFKNTLGYQVLQVCLIKWFHMLLLNFSRIILFSYSGWFRYITFQFILKFTAAVIMSCSFLFEHLWDVFTSPRFLVGTHSEAFFCMQRSVQKLIESVIISVRFWMLSSSERRLSQIANQRQLLDFHSFVQSIRRVTRIGLYFDSGV